MSDADQLRNRATRLLALAIRSREDGHPQYAEELTKFASEAFEQATDMDRRFAPNPATWCPWSTPTWLEAGDRRRRGTQPTAALTFASKEEAKAGAIQIPRLRP
jgi:hypothetical protein